MSSTDWQKLKNRSDAEIRKGVEQDSDARGTDAAFWEKAAVKLPESKESVTIRLDADILEWFRAGGRGYQTRINAVLRSYVTSQKKTG